MNPDPRTTLWWWPLPADGETVPAHPPVELTGVSIEGDLEFDDEDGGPSERTSA